MKLPTFVAIGLTLAATLPASAGPASSTQPADSSIRVLAAWHRADILSWAETCFHRSRPGVRVEREDIRSLDPQTPWIDDLAAGKFEVVIYNGRLCGDARPERLVESLRRKGCAASVVGIRVVGIAVHPSSRLLNVDHEKVVALLGAGGGSWAELGRPDGAAVSLQVEGRAVMAFPVKMPSRPEVQTFQIDKALDAAADNEQALYVGVITPRLINTGLKILPVASTQSDGRPVEPTPHNVMTGSYPFGDYIMVAIGPRASDAARGFAAVFEGSDMARSLAGSNYAKRPGYVLAGGAVSMVWPAIVDPPPRTPIDGAVAILPAQPLSSHFRFANAPQQAAYEQAVADGIAQDGRLKLVDRNELRRALDERTLRLAAGTEKPDEPIIAADVLIVPCIDTVSSGARLLIKAIHAPTATCIGLLELPINPGDPTQFDPPLDQTIARWWPGVLENLAAARRKPVLAVLRSGDEPEVEDVCRAVRDSLAASNDVFLADYHMLPDTQREVLMRLMGLSRASGKFSSAADYVLECRSVGTGAVQVTLMQGPQLATAAVAELNGSDLGGQATRWLVKQMAGLRAEATEHRWAPATARQVEAASEHARQLRQQWEKLLKQADDQRREIRAPAIAAEDLRRLFELGNEMVAACGRACQLNPTSEELAWAHVEAISRIRNTFHLIHYRYSKQMADAASAFLDSFPASPRFGQASLLAIGSYRMMLRAVEEDFDRKFWQLPAGADRPRLSRLHRRQLLQTNARYFARIPPPRGRDGDMPAYWFALRLYVQDIRLYAKTPECTGPGGQAAIALALAEYAQATAGSPSLLHVDFVRLLMLIDQNDVPGYTQLLAQLQSRWPDPADAHWRFAGELVANTIQWRAGTEELHRSLSDWLRSKPAATTR